MMRGVLRRVQRLRAAALLAAVALLAQPLVHGGVDASTRALLCGPAGAAPIYVDLRTGEVSEAPEAASGTAGHCVLCWVPGHPPLNAGVGERAAAIPAEARPTDRARLWAAAGGMSPHRARAPPA